ncbi:hypothetical protein BDD14_3469 [Edaphobacter modestus]|uniref:Uncharacterized protein n=1 Tax=Edaphobacter modestus TaxID=388466 RepID=A0A4Q7YVV4_9BACT|nr:hypothetical protein BDD14_3469 [Edaphobacter modestus]
MRSLFLKQQILISLLLFAAVAYLPSNHSRQDSAPVAISHGCSLASH